MDDDSPARLPKVATYIWSYKDENRVRSNKPRKHVVEIQSSPETSEAARRIIAKYDPKKRTRRPKSAESQPSSLFAASAIKTVALLRPQKDAVGAKERKKNKRRLIYQLARQRKLRAAAAKKRRLQSQATRRAKTETDTGDVSRNTLFDNLMRQVIHSVRGTRKYTHARVEKIAKIGTCPSAGGSRSAIASILTHNGDSYVGK